MFGVTKTQNFDKKKLFRKIKIQKIQEYKHKFLRKRNKKFKKRKKMFVN